MLMMYCNYLCITLPPLSLNFEILKNNFLCIICTDFFFFFLELAVVKSNVNLSFVQLFIDSYSLKLRIKSLHYVLKYKIYIVFRANTWICS